MTDSLPEHEAKFVEAVEACYPSPDTIQGGVRSGEVAAELGVTANWTATRLKSLARRGYLRRLAGRHGPTYAPVED